jgi:hypothetical protein
VPHAPGGAALGGVNLALLEKEVAPGAAPKGPPGDGEQKRAVDAAE